MTGQELLKELLNHFSDYAVKNYGNWLVFTKGAGDGEQSLKVSVEVDFDGGQCWTIDKGLGNRVYPFSLKSAIAAVGEWLPAPHNPDNEQPLPSRPVIQQRG